MSDPQPRLNPRADDEPPDAGRTTPDETLAAPVAPHAAPTANAGTSELDVTLTAQALPDTARAGASPSAPAAAQVRAGGGGTMMAPWVTSSDSLMTMDAQDASVDVSIHIASDALHLESAQAEQARQNLAEGTVIQGRYTVLGVLGAGGMGTVYRIRDALDGQEWALKMASPAFYNTEAGMLRFRQEYQAMTALQHPNLPRVREYGLTESNAPFMVMELVKGASPVTGEQLPLTLFYRLFVQFLHALSFIHSRGFLHRDIKPANAIIDASDPDAKRLVLLDFGLMERIGSASEKRIAGTPSYMAPEIVKGQMLDPRTDLYAVGVSAYVMLTGEVPFHHPRLEDLFRLHEMAPRPRVSALNPEVPPALDDLLLRLIAADPQDRPANVEDVLMTLAPLTDQVQASDVQARRTYLRISDIVAREPQRQALRAGLEAAEHAAASTLIVQGVTGSGKSRLLADVQQHALVRGFAVAIVTVREDHRAPFQAIRALVRALQPLATERGMPPEDVELRWLLQGYNADAGATVDLSAQPGPISDSVADLVPDRLGMALAMREWLGRLAATKPILLVADDLQWCDDSSLQVFRDLLATDTDCRIMLVGACRSDEVASGSDLDRWRGTDAVTLLETRLFSADELRDFIDGLLGAHSLSPEVQARIQSLTAGNPFFTIELLRDLIDRDLLIRQAGIWRILAPDFDLPDSVHSLLLQRFERLDQDGQWLIRMLTVAGGTLRTPDLAALFGGPEAPLLAGIEATLQHKLTLQANDRLTLVHDSLRQAVYADMPTALRSELHQRLAEHLQAGLPVDHPSRPALLGHHFARGRDRLKGLQQLEIAGRLAFRQEQHDAARSLLLEAEELLESTPNLPDTEARLYEIKKMLSHICMSSDFIRGAAYAEWVYQHAMQRGILFRMPRLRELLPDPLPWLITAGVYLPVHLFIRRREGMREFRRDLTDILMSTSYMTLCLASMSKLTTARIRAERLHSFALTRNGLVHAFVTIAQAMARNHQDSFAARRDFQRARKSLRTPLARPIPLYERVLMIGATHYTEALYAAWEQNTDFDDHYRELVHLADRHDHRYLRHLQHQARLERHAIAGQVDLADRAEADFRDAVNRLGGRVRQREWLVDLSMGCLDVDAGRVDRATRRLNRLRAEPPGYFTSGFAGLLGGLLNLSWNKLDDAEADLNEALRWARDPEVLARHFEFRVLGVLADLQLQRGDHAAVEQTLKAMAPFPRSPDIRTRYFAIELGRRRAQHLAATLPRAALGVARETLELARIVNSPRQLATCHLLLADVSDTCSLPEAESSAHRDAALALFKTLGNRHQVAQTQAIRQRAQDSPPLLRS